VKLEALFDLGKKLCSASIYTPSNLSHTSAILVIPYTCMCSNLLLLSCILLHYIIATNSVFIYYTRHAKYFTYSCLGLLVHCLGLGLEPQCLGLGLGTYCPATITDKHILYYTFHCNRKLST